MDAVYALSLVVFLPALVALLLSFFPTGQRRADQDRHDRHDRSITFGLCLGIDGRCRSTSDQAEMQQVFNYRWIPSFDIDYFMGVDGISFPLVVLTAFVSVLAMGASWSITKHVKAYCILFLLLETGMLGVFLALDFFLFYVFWEVMLLPMYFLIGVWGGPRRGIRGHQVLPLHAGRQRADADRHPDAVLQQRSDAAVGDQLAERRCCGSRLCQRPDRERGRSHSDVGEAAAI